MGVGSFEGADGRFGLSIGLHEAAKGGGISWHGAGFPDSAAWQAVSRSSCAEFFAVLPKLFTMDGTVVNRGPPKGYQRL